MQEVNHTYEQSYWSLTPKTKDTTVGWCVTAEGMSTSAKCVYGNVGVNDILKVNNVSNININIGGVNPLLPQTQKNNGYNAHPWPC
jgi:hypothetical protein